MRDINLGDTIYPKFTTRAFATGVPTTLAGTPVLSVYEENNLTQITAGVSVTVDYDSVTGLNQATIVATSGNGYEAGKSYDLVITTGTVGGVSVVGEVVFSFTVEDTTALMPTTAGRSLDVTATGEAGIDLDNTNGTLAAAQIASNAFTAAKFAASSLDGKGDWNTTTPPTAAAIVNEWETQSQADPTGFHVNVLEVGGTAQTANDNGADINTLINGVSLNAGAITNASLAGNMEIVFETDFATNYNTTRNGWTTNVQDTIGTGTLGLNDFDPANDTVANVTLVATTTTNTDMRGTDGANTVVPDAAGTAPTAVEIRQEMDSNSTQLAAIVADSNELQTDWADGGRLDNILDAILVDTGTTLPGLIDDLAIKKNTAFSNFEFLMVLTSDHVTPATGLTVTGQRSIDGGAFASVSGTIAEVSNGIYQFDALAADTNGDVITWRFSSATADDTFVTFKTVA